MERMTAANGMSFRVGFTGYSGHLRVEPLPPVEGPDPRRGLPDFILPPAFEPETRESVRKQLEEHLSPILDPDEFSAEKAGMQWDFDWFDRAKLHVDPSAPRSVMVPAWELPFRRKKDDNLPGIWDPDSVEIEVPKLMEGAEDLGSLSRMPGPAKDFVRGNTKNRPFRPGGPEETLASESRLPRDACNGNWIHEILGGSQPQKIPPGFKHGIDLGPLKEYPYTWNCHKNQSELLQGSFETILSMQFADIFGKEWEENIDPEQKSGPESVELEADMGEMPVTLDPEPGEMPATNVSLDVEAGRDETPVHDATHDRESILDKIMATGPGSLEGKTRDDCKSDQLETWGMVATQDIASNFYQLVPELALDFPFELDKFQKEAIYFLERGESVFVAAHTSAGKTVVAEYAFALASKHCTRAVYTAPIKTISNQKYRDFCGKFDVGLLTGDVSLKPEASCLIMTTEILRSMLYKGADIIRDIEWVIFDEVHYVNDVERGVVWEEVIIMLPRHVNIILLSATVPNTRDFADWIGRTKQKKIHVTVTYKRPVPLEHYLFFSGELYKICENENFMVQGFRAAKDADRKKKLMAVSGMAGGGAGKRPVSQSRGQTIQSEKSGSGKGFKHSGPPVSEGFSVTSGGHQNNRNSWRTEAALWLTLIKKLLKKNLLPVVIFCFSKTRCDKSADNLTGIDLTSSSEKSQIIVFCNKAFSRLKGTDRNLPQVVRLQNLLKKGIGVHHAGLLPIVKEVVEMLFCRGLVKVLFSTETFAMGVNAPARTVVFDALRKFDGKEFRSLLPGEYIQMAGRAGRRGLDDIGTVMVLCRDEVPDEAVLKHVITGMPTKLESQFRLTYIMILHLLRLEELKVEDMLKRSFAEYHGQKTMPEKQKLLMLELQKPTKTVECIKGEPAIEEYFSLASEVEELREKISEALMQSPTAQKYLTPGRVIIIRNQSVEDNLLGLVLKTPAQTKKLIVLMLTTETATSKQASSVSFNKLEANDKSNSPGGYFVLPKGKRAMDDYVSSVTSRKGSGEVKIKLPYSGFAAGYNYEVTEIDHKEILSICEVKIKIDQVGLLEEPSNSTYSRTIQQLLPKKTGENKYPKALDPINDLKLNNIDHVEAYTYCNVLLQKMTDNKCHGCVKLKEHMALMKEINQHREKVNALTYEMSDEALTQMPDFQGRIDVLKEIGCIDSELAVQIKGRVACEMNSGEELICTECLFDNQLEDLEPEEAVALMSAFVFQQKNTSEPNLNIRLSNAKKRLHATAIRLGKLQAEFRLPVIPEDYAQDNLKFGLVEVVYEWAKGTPFAEICELTDVPEGLIVRTIVRLDETCREFKNAASIMGNSALYKKMEVASNAIKRDIVFAASLYVTGVE